MAAHRPGRSPSQRFRYEQFLPFLHERGFECDSSWILSEADDARFYRRGHWGGKLRIFLKSAVTRLEDVRRASSYDIVFVQREAFMTGSSWFEERFARSGAKLVFDFDDAIWRFDVSDANRALGWLKKPGKTARIIAASHCVIAGNAYLADYARRFNPAVHVIPSTVDTDEYRPPPPRDPDVVCIGWSGSATTLRHFELALPALAELRRRFGARVAFRVMGDGVYRNDALGVEGVRWSAATEVQQLARFDVGIMPLPDDEWSKGKCGMKGLQYMALAVPTVMSPVGVNPEIIDDGRNGFLAATTGEWVAKLAALVESAGLRRKLGEAGRRTVVERYSVASQRGRLVDVLRGVLSP